MYCTNCGQEMLDTDKFCAECGTQARPRRISSPTAAERARAAAFGKVSTPQPPQSTAELFTAPLTAQSSPGSAEASRSSTHDRRDATESVPAQGSIFSETPEEAERSLVEMEELSAVRGRMPLDALPADVPLMSKAPAGAGPAGQTCETCGKLNPAANQFCEACGASLSADAVQSSVSEGESGSAASVSPTPSSAADFPEPELRSPQAATSSASPSLGEGEQFSYYYDDKAARVGSPKLLIAAAVVLLLGILGVLYLILAPSKGASSGVSVAIAPSEAQLTSGQSLDFAATVTGDRNTDVVWSIQEGEAGGQVSSKGAQADGSKISMLAVYTAPSSPGAYHLIATSKADPTKSASAEITVSKK